MKKILLTLMLAAASILSTLTLTSCGDDEPVVNPQGGTTTQPETSDPADDSAFRSLYGYWLNSDNSGAMEIKRNSNSRCSVNYYVYTTNGVKSRSSDYYGGNSSFTALTPDGQIALSVRISSQTSTRILLEKQQSQYSNLSSYVFSKVSEDAFFHYIENGGNTSPEPTPEESDAQKLIGTWVGMDFSDTFTITFYSSGKASETWTDGYDTETSSGTYTFANGRITEWNMNEGSILSNTLGDCPWPVTFNSLTSITLGSGYNKITFTKK